MRGRDWRHAWVLVAVLAAAPALGLPGVRTHERGRLRSGIDLAADYLVRNCDETGRFRYRVDPRAGVSAKRGYNILRHAGSIYALGMVEARRSDERTRAAMVRAARFLKTSAVRPVEGHPGLLAVWSDDEETGHGAGSRVAKLGGTGLGLVALLTVEQVRPKTTPIEDLRSLGRFALFMQKEDGSFHSKYLPSEGGRDDRFTSLYYPGETALGLVLLYEKDGSAAWLRGAADALAHLARSRQHQEQLPPDHWALLATARLLPLWHRTHQPLPEAELVAHAARVCESILADDRGQRDAGPDLGSLTADDRTCPTATRIEGLLAALTFLPAEYDDLRGRILPAVQDGIGFLLRAQITSGEHAGGIPRALEPESPRSTEIRIDYVQHALSAMIQYLDTTAPSVR